MANEKSLYHMFREVVDTAPESIAYRFKKDGRWHDVTWRQQDAAVRLVGRALLSLGAEKGDRVGIVSYTRLEWTQCDFGIGCAGGATVGIYHSSLAEDCAYILNHSRSKFVFVENREQLDKLMSVRSDLETVEWFVMFDGAGDAENNVLAWQEFLARAEDVEDARLEERVETLGADDLASLVYTSGTTGVPKGAMITHGNLLFAAWSSSECLNLSAGQVTLLFLPLAHVFARLVVYFALRNNVTTAFAESLETVADNLKEIRPHFIASVPRIYEKVYDKIHAGVRDAGGIKEKLFNWAVETGMEAGCYRQAQQPVPAVLSLKYALATKLVFHKIHAALGGRMLWAVSGAAPLNKTIAEFFHACGVLILEGLGMTENTSFTNVNRESGYKFGTVGPVGPEIEMKAAPDGEILFRGRNVMKGYYRNPEATAESIDGDGWLHTGDVGEIDSEGFLKITDRKKDLIITAGGKNIAPQRIEQTLSTSHFINQVLAFGDRRKYLVALVTLDSEQVTKWAATESVEYADATELCRHPRIKELIELEVEKANGKLASFETVKKTTVIPGEFTVEAGELTPTLKLKRKVVVEKYNAEIEAMYAE